MTLSDRLQEATKRRGPPDDPEEARAYWASRKPASVYPLKARLDNRGRGRIMMSRDHSRKEAEAEARKFLRANPKVDGVDVYVASFGSTGRPSHPLLFVVSR